MVNYKTIGVKLLVHYDDSQMILKICEDFVKLSV